MKATRAHSQSMKHTSEGVRNFRRFLGKSRVAHPGRLGLRAPKAFGFFRIPSKVLVASFLRAWSLEYHVFRAAFLTIVLTLVVGPDASLLCRVWCDQHPPAAKECHHRDSGRTSPTVANSTTCDNVAGEAFVFLREDAPRTASAPIGDHAIEILPLYRLAASTIDSPLDYEPEYEWAQEKRPLVTTLRL